MADHGMARAPSGWAGCLLATTTPHTAPERRFSTAAPLIPGLIVSEAQDSRHGEIVYAAPGLIS